MRWDIVRRRRLVAALAAVVALAVVAAALLGGGEDARRPAAPAPTSLLDALAPVIGTGASRSAPAEGDLGVPLDRAAAQLFVVGLAGTTSRAPFLRRLRVRDWGGVLLTRRNWGGSRARLARLVRALRATARRARHTPPLVMAVPPGDPGGATVPGAAGPQLRPARAATRAAPVFARLDLDAVLGIPFDVAYAAGPWEGRGLPPQRAPRLALRAAQRWRSAGVEPVPGHFPGEGAATADPRVAPASVGLGRDELERGDLAPFRAAAAEVRAVQLSASFYAAFDAVTPATLLPAAIRLLRRTDPDAVAVSADLQVAALATGRPVDELAVEALRAGCDLLVLPGDAADQERAFRAVVRAIRTGELPRRRVQAALLRIASFKRRAGVVGAPSG